jgi:hypothetical protein
LPTRLTARSLRSVCCRAVGRDRSAPPSSRNSGVGADALGEILDAGHADVATLGDDVGGSELAGELLPDWGRIWRSGSCGQRAV